MEKNFTINKNDTSPFSYFFKYFEVKDILNPAQIKSSFFYRRYVCWMSFLKGTVFLKDLYLFGTINSINYEIDKTKNQSKASFLFYDINQNFNILSQLLYGVRFINIIFNQNKEKIFEIINNQIKAFYENFNPSNSEILFIKFVFLNIISIEEKLIIKAKIFEILELNIFSIKKSEINENLEYFRRKAKRYVILWQYYPNEETNDIFLSDNDLLEDHIFDLHNNKDYSICYENKFQYIEIKNNNKDLISPFLFEKAFCNEIKNYFKYDKKSKINIYAKNFIDLDLNIDFIDYIIQLNLQNDNFSVDSIYLNFLSSSKIYEKSLKLTKKDKLNIGKSYIPKSIIFFSKEIIHKVNFENLLTTCFTKRYEIININCPDNYVISYISLDLNTEKTNKINVTLKEGWILENKIQIKIKSLGSFILKIIVEIIPIQEKIFVLGL